MDKHLEAGLDIRRGFANVLWRLNDFFRTRTSSNTDLYRYFVG
jgi:hypothetical protein